MRSSFYRLILFASAALLVGCGTEQPPVDPNAGIVTIISGSGEEVEIPAWCEPHYELDNNCDGLDDETGEALL